LARLFALLLLAACGAGAGGRGGPPSAAAERAVRLDVRIVARYPHDPAAFTQGLVWHDGWLLESTGLYGASSVRRVEPATGRVEQQAALPGHLFGEGLARVGDRLVQLTWREGVARVLDLASLEVVSEHRYAGEGWGLCFDGLHLVMSDGSDRLTLRDPGTFAEVGSLPVTLDGAPLTRLNELECADGWVYANVWGSDWIARIEPGSGIVRAVADASSLLSETERAGADVLNGIAFDPQRRLFLVTGKLWPALFAVELMER
jgi:glutaminyl-peptide cyclotransferase